jgi:hypothetical protein
MLPLRKRPLTKTIPIKENQQKKNGEREHWEMHIAMENQPVMEKKNDGKTVN